MARWIQAIRIHHDILSRYDLDEKQHRLVDLNLAESKGELRDTFRAIRKTLMSMIKIQPLYPSRVAVPVT